jgi:hypothetical protein
MKRTPRSPLRLAAPVLAALALAGCAPETTLCQVDGSKYLSDDGMLTVYVNPVIYVRVFGSDPFEATGVTISVINNGSVISPPQRYRDFLSDPGGTYVCPRSRNAEGSLMTGIRVGRFPASMQFGLSVRVVINDAAGGSRTLTLPVARLRPLEEDMPAFQCTSTRCGR